MNESEIVHALNEIYSEIPAWNPSDKEIDEMMAYFAA